MTKAVLGIIGGSGIYDLPGLEKVRQRKINSPWGEPRGGSRRDSAATSSKRAPLIAANGEKCNKRERSNRDRQGANQHRSSCPFPSEPSASI